MPEKTDRPPADPDQPPQQRKAPPTPPRPEDGRRKRWRFRDWAMI